MLSALLLIVVVAVIPSEIRAQERYTVSYGGFAGYHAPLWAAKDLGLFAKYGLNGRSGHDLGFPARVCRHCFPAAVILRSNIDAGKGVRRSGRRGFEHHGDLGHAVDCIEKIKLYADARLFTQEAMPALRSL